MAKPGEGEGSLGRREKAGVRKQNRKTDGDWTPGGQNRNIRVHIKRILLSKKNNKDFHFHHDHDVNDYAEKQRYAGNSY